MAVVKIDLRLKPHQLKAASHPAKTKFYQGGVRSGKTHTAAAEVFRVCNNYAGTRAFVGRKDFTALRESALETYLKLIPSEIRNYNQQTHTITLRSNGSQIIFADLKDWRKYGSWELGICHLVEVMELSKQCYDMLDTRLSQKEVPYQERKMILDSNPVHQYHWAYKLRQERKNDSDFYFQIFKTYEMIDILGEQYIANLEKKGPRFVKIMLEGETGFLAEGDPVFKEFSEARHMAEQPFQPIPGLPIRKGYDVGWDCPACVWFQIDPRDRILVLACLVGSDMSTNDFGNEVLKFEQEHFGSVNPWMGIDPSGKSNLPAADQTDIEILQQLGFKCYWMASTPKQRHGFIRHKLTTDRILLNADDCQELYEAFMGGYCLAKEPANEDDIKHPNHPYKDVMDAFGYGLVNAGVPLIDKPKEARGRQRVDYAPPLASIMNPGVRS